MLGCLAVLQEQMYVVKTLWTAAIRVVSLLLSSDVVDKGEKGWGSSFEKFEECLRKGQNIGEGESMCDEWYRGRKLTKGTIIGTWKLCEGRLGKVPKSC